MLHVKIGLLLSGGVDSSVALFLLKKQYPDAEITAWYLKIWLEDELASLGSCPWAEDLEYARAVCAQAKIPLKIINMQQEYRELVVSYTIDELKRGRTPSPDIFCNRRIKFGAFLNRIGNSVDKVASGHYAIVERNFKGLFHIKRAKDPIKDQSYFLSHLTQEQVALTLFPLGELTKKKVRNLAEKWDLPNKKRKDSQGICFLGKIKYAEFVKHYLGEKRGSIIEAETGRILGTHKGTWFHTIGQRSGLGLSGGPWYVVARNQGENTVTVGHASQAIDVAVSQFSVTNPNWISGRPKIPANVTIKLRHGPKLIAGHIASYSQSRNPCRLLVCMEESDRGVAPGQFSVFYNEDVCLGGAMIE